MSLLGLAAAYDSDSDSDSNGSDGDNEVVKREVKEEVKVEQVREVLANPFSTATSRLNVKPSFMQETEKIAGVKFDNSVFQNPFRDKEDKKTAVLEQHVGMTQKEQTGRTIDGKKVCWMFRKGRCRQGHRCKFAHDNDIKNAVTEKLYTETKTYEPASQISNDKAKKGAAAPLPLEREVGGPVAGGDKPFDHIHPQAHKLMEKMGWEAGKGLGARGHGIKNAITVSYSGGGQGKVAGRRKEEEEEEQVVRKKRPGVGDGLTLVSSSANPVIFSINPTNPHSCPCRARRPRPSTTKCTNSNELRDIPATSPVTRIVIVQGNAKIMKRVPDLGVTCRPLQVRPDAAMLRLCCATARSAALLRASQTRGGARAQRQMSSGGGGGAGLKVGGGRHQVLCTPAPRHLCTLNLFTFPITMETLGSWRR